MVSAIIPAFNEEKTIAGLVAVLKKSPLLKEIIVVDDGSKDKTYKRAKEAGARVIRHNENRGKAQALNTGVSQAKADILLFLDADLRYFNLQHIELLVGPVIRGEVDVTVGSIDRGNTFNRWLSHFESPFSGLRALKRDFWEKIPEDFKKSYYIESALTYFAKTYRLRTRSFVLSGVKHCVKEKKYGLLLGLGRRFKMLFEIGVANVLLRVTKFS